jgi:hypothetical protein
MTKDQQYVQDFVFLEMQRSGDDNRIKELNYMYQILSGSARREHFTPDKWDFYVDGIEAIINNRIKGVTKVIKDMKCT